MTDFSHLQKLQVEAKRLVTFILYQVEGEPSLSVAPATEANKPYYNKLLQRSSGTTRRIRAAGVSPALVRENRENDKELYARYVVCGWSGVKDSAGKEVPFSHEAALEFLQALPDYLFDQLREFCSEPSNFVEKDAKGEAEIGATAGN